MLIPRVPPTLRRALLALAMLLALSGRMLAGPAAETQPSTQPFELAQNSHCGPICLWQVGVLHGLKFSIQEIAGMAKTDRFKGTTVKGMLDAAAGMGLEAQAVTTDLAWLAKDKRLAIVLLDLASGENKVGHFAIISRIEDDAVVLLDGASTKRLSVSDFRAGWHGVAILIGSKPPEARAGHPLLGSAIFSAGLGIAIVGGILLALKARRTGGATIPPANAR